MSEKELQDLTVADLRKRVREEKGIVGTVVLTYSKNELVALLAEDAEPPAAIINNPVLTRKEENGGNGKSDDHLATIIAAAIQDKINVTGQVDEAAVIKLARNEAVNQTANLEQFVQSSLERLDKKIDENSFIKKLEVKITEMPAVNVGVQHTLFEKILKLVALRKNIMLVGPAGSGKTTVGKSSAKALSLPFYAQAVGLQTTKTDLLGYMDANGKYVPSLLRRAYENGGVFVLDEIDGGNANVLTILNSLLDNGVGAFPDGMIARHKDFICIATANTYGRGADRMYVGRNQLDAATLDRFIVVDFDYDENFELALGANQAWTKKIQKLRQAIFELKERVICSPRASITGAEMLANGFEEKEILDMLVFKGVSMDIKQKILARGWV